MPGQENLICRPFGELPERSREIKFDWITGLLVFLLIATLYAFFTGVFPYPYGWVVITALLVFRLTATGKTET